MLDEIKGKRINILIGEIGALLHDIGKMHPKRYFYPDEHSKKMRKENITQGNNKNDKNNIPLGEVFSRFKYCLCPGTKIEEKLDVKMDWDGTLDF